MKPHRPSLPARLAVAVALAITGAATPGPWLGTAAAAEQDAVLRVGVGEQTTLKLPAAAQRLSLGNPAVAGIDVLSRTGGRELLVTGKAPGSTTLLVWLPQRAEPMRWRVSVNAAVPSSLRPGAPQVQADGEVVVLSGEVDDAGAHEEALTLAKKAAGPEGTVIDRSVIRVSEQVQVSVKVVEFSKTLLNQAGINIFSSTAGFTFGVFSPNTLGGISLPAVTRTGTGGPITVSGVPPIAQAFNLVAGVGANGLSGYLSLMEANNLLHVLAEPTLVARSGHKASFLAGGEIPVPVPQSSGNGSNTITIQYKKYGVGLDLVPTVVSKDKIALQVAPTVSALDYQHAVLIQGFEVPALTTRQVETSVTLGDGESLIIGGLVNRQMQQNIQKMPLLGDLPIIGAFFRNISYQKTDTELAIIVTPRLVHPVAAGAELPPLPGAELERTRFSLGRAMFLPGDGRAPKDDDAAAPGLSD
ncbi:type II and III secretion system protein family protein [Caldimonas thermodepolymerans]|jgi:Flp pilus assembly protein, secretin CpaC|uniref:Type II and III secretion system protein n=1 Tax=Caldimonas thermodepolymerans TaxID=215580 RepID=A0A2S5T823_9BURK|nr:type II and III secretion system protein family protein [Caldimonas thermodepolymerans]PPE71155.1 type II and III secretion system protein [Caldimonas thermodepolymerans]QPC31458.1 type II and III secretion system protein family protein [Caldimonas thermodepolymerans]RDH99569.1 pilus assembly protein CpaC [Caldimonas thermodepolymerans]